MPMLLPEAVGTGLLAVLLFGELFGISAGGMLAPGFLALQFDDPRRLGVLAAVVMATYLLMRLAGRVMLLYGRRRFVLTVLVGFCLGLGAGHGLGLPLAEATESRTIGLILPGLVAHGMGTHGVLVTSATLVVLTVATRLILLAAFGAVVPV